MNFIETLQSEIKKEREVIQKKQAKAIRDHTNAINSKIASIKKQHDIDEKKALMELWKVKLTTAVVAAIVAAINLQL